MRIVVLPERHMCMACFFEGDHEDCTAPDRCECRCHDVTAPHDRPDCPCEHPLGEVGPCAGCNCGDPR